MSTPHTNESLFSLLYTKVECFNCLGGSLDRPGEIEVEDAASHSDEFPPSHYETCPVCDGDGTVPLKDFIFPDEELQKILFELQYNYGDLQSAIYEAEHATVEV